MMAILDGQAFGAYPCGNNGKCRSPGLQNLNTGATASQQRHNRDFPACQFFDRVRHRAGYFDPWVPERPLLNSMRIFPDQTPDQTGPSLSQKGPNLQAEETDRRHVRVVLQIAGKNDGFFLIAAWNRNKRDRVGINRYARAGREGKDYFSVLGGWGED